LSSNQLTDCLHLQKLRFASQINLSRNLISDGRFLSNAGIFPLLKTLSLANNKLTSLPAVLLGSLTHLNLNGNLIVSLEDFDGHPKLEVLELRGNRISSLKGLGKAPQLRELYLAENSLTSLNGLGAFPKLEKLHIRKNKIASIPAMPSLLILRSLNLRENAVSKLADVAGVSASVSVLNLLANPVSEEMGDNTKKEVWMKYRQYQRVNKSDVTPEEKEEFDKEYKERVAEQERQEKEAREQAEREAAEKEAAEKGEA
jgi:Leucine-rich repeat (LRR) protein